MDDWKNDDLIKQGYDVKFVVEEGEEKKFKITPFVFSPDGEVTEIETFETDGTTGLDSIGYAVDEDTIKKGMGGFPPKDSPLYIKNNLFSNNNLKKPEENNSFTILKKIKTQSAFEE